MNEFLLPYLSSSPTTPPKCDGPSLPTLCLNSLVTEDVYRGWLAPTGLVTEVTPVKLIMPTHGDWLVKGCAES